MRHAQESYESEDDSEKKKKQALRILNVVYRVFVLIWVAQLIPAILCDMGVLEEHWNIVVIAVTLVSLFCIWLCEKISNWLEGDDDDEEEEFPYDIEDEDTDGENL